MRVTRERILVVDDDENMLIFFEGVLRKAGYAVLSVSSGEEALQILEKQEFALMLSDLVLPGIDGIALVQRAKKIDPTLPCVVLTGHGSVRSAVAAMKEGASDYLTKPVDLEEFKLVVEKALELQRLNREVKILREQVGSGQYLFPHIIGHGKAIRTLLHQVKLVATSDTVVLLQGESGTGKELVARAIHERSPRRGHPFVVLDCGSVPESLLESELFGYSKGAFTGATTNKKGLFEEAHGGTVFLDEIGDISPTFQSKLLRVLQTHEIRPVGNTKHIAVDVRMVAATNKDLRKLVASKQFREDLYYRLAVIRLTLPALRERREDIPLLAEHFIRKFCEKEKLPPKRLSPAALRVLMAASWPGNVRELEHTIERAVLLSPDLKIQPQSIVIEPDLHEMAAMPPQEAVNHAHFLLNSAEREKLEAALKQARGNRSQAAKLLKISRSTLYEKIKRHVPTDPAASSH
jgi:DNA-binding NtrC family response regulator